LLDTDPVDEVGEGVGQGGLRSAHEGVLTGENLGPVGLGGFEPGCGGGVSGEGGGIEALALAQEASLLVGDAGG
jgi:hypothetical protein